jgi:serine protease Do
MTSLFRRGAAAALISLTAADLASAQAAGATIRQRQAGDSIIVRGFGVGKFDTIAVLFRAFEHEPYGSPGWIEMMRRVDSLVSVSPRVMLRANLGDGVGIASAVTPRGWIGFNAQGPAYRTIDRDGERVTYFAYPSILSVDPESPADKAGIVPGDLLVAFNGTDVVGHEFNITRLVVPDTKVGVTIRRDGQTKDYSLDIVKAPDGVYSRRLEFTRVPGMPLSEIPGTMIMRLSDERGDGAMRGAGGGAAAGSGTSGGRAITLQRAASGVMRAGRFTVIGPHSVFGADVSPVNADLARVLKLEKGILVNEVPDASPAFKAGLRIGDVIVAVAGQSVATVGQLQDVIVSRIGDRTVPLQVMRDRKPVKITVTW